MIFDNSIKAVVQAGSFTDAETHAISTAATILGVNLATGPEARDSADAFIISASEKAHLSDLSIRGRPFLLFGDLGKAERTHANLTFGYSRGLPMALQGRTLSEKVPARGIEIAGSFIEPAVTSGEKVIWGLGEKDDRASFVVATPPPQLAPGQCFTAAFNGETFLDALPLWLFLRQLSPSETRWQAPSLRACLVADDPNLRFSKYGHVDYGKLVTYASMRPFHAAMAMVPLDGWSHSAGTARLFRENTASLSLLIHGNNHANQELAAQLPDPERLGMIEQSLQRMTALEKKAAVHVDRVMAPPYGVCAPETMRLLWRTGYEGMTTNRWSLWKHSPQETLPTDFGLRPADMLAGGLPVIPRYRFKSSIFQNELHLAALLGQPLLPYGHQQDFADDMREVKTAAESINALGPVRWMSMREIFESNFETCEDGTTFRIRLFSRRVKGTLPRRCSMLSVELPPAAADWQTEIIVSAKDQPDRRIQGAKAVAELPEGSDFEVRLAASNGSLPTGGATARRQPKAILRRLAAEARDRLRL